MAIEDVEIFGSKRRVSRSGAKFAAALNEIAGKLDDNVKLFTKQTALRLFTKITQGTPVDTGYARASWNFATTPEFIYLPKPDTTGRRKKTKTEVKNSAAELYQRPLTKDAGKTTALSYTYYITNPLPYILTLEAGNSKQAPTGFIANATFATAKELQNKK